MNILVTGGAGYVGSHCVKTILSAGHRPVVIDNLSRGHQPAIDPRAIFVAGDVGDEDLLVEVFREHGIDCVLHFAALAYVGESVELPLTYYQNNVSGSLSLMRAMDRAGVRKIVFSSTCATYGVPDDVPIREEAPQNPINPYGASKQMVERIIEDFAGSDPRFAYTLLRYFNVAGCASDGSLGEDHRPETHLIPLCLSAARGRQSEICVLGTNYDTPDGSCIRDYIHVEDLCDAHLLAAENLGEGEHRVYNLGTGRGYSVLEVIESVRRVTGRNFQVEERPRRPGDPPVLVADATRAQKDLGWKPRYTRLDDIVATAWRWVAENPEGYVSEIVGSCETE